MTTVNHKVQLHHHAAYHLPDSASCPEGGMGLALVVVLLVQHPRVYSVFYQIC
jgi:hypothetical protein